MNSANKIDRAVFIKAFLKLVPRHGSYSCYLKKRRKTTEIASIPLTSCSKSKQAEFRA